MRQRSQQNSASPKVRGFTLIELVVVIAIIVLMLAAAVPLVRVVQGNRSIEAGHNAVAAALGHARQLAIYYRQPAGVVFYRDPITGLQDINYVMRANFMAQNTNLFPQYPLSYALTNKALPDSYFDLVNGEQMITLPTGLALQVVIGNGALLQPAPDTRTERYIRFGAILFDENGELETVPYAFPAASIISVALNPTTPALPYFSQFPLAAGYTSPLLFSNQAICLYDEQSFSNQVDNGVGTTIAGTGDDFSDANENTITYNTSTAATRIIANANPTSPFPKEVITGTFPDFQKDKLAEQIWLDQNAEIFVVKPNDGSLLRNK
jgi:prepilin-type N-terminal cleavage/methylation domain-containing protein